MPFAPTSLRRLVTALLSLTALLALAASAHAAYPGRDGAIAFVGTNAQGEQSILVRGAGRVRALLRGEVVDNPVYSPSGQRIAINRDTAESGRAVWILQANGADPRQLTAAGAPAAEPTWAPDGRSLAYASGDTGARTLHVIAANGLGDRQLTTGPADQYSPAWSSRGIIAFVQAGPQGTDIYRVGAGGGTPVRLTSKPGDDVDPAWGPHGTRLAFVRGHGGIWTMDANGRNLQKVVRVKGGIEHGIAWSPDGRQLVFAGGPDGHRRLYTVDVNGKGLRAITGAGADPRDPDWRSAGHDPVIGAAGDIACDPDSDLFKNGAGTPHYCGMMRTADLLLRPDLAAVLALGDLQYPDGTLDDFYRSFAPTWGPLGSLLHPAPGNHEYNTTDAAGYFDYFNGVGIRTGRAGDRTKGGYYSFNVGTWHVIALNSNCTLVPGGCDVGSPQQRWLQADLVAHPAKCTLAFWHHPLFSSINNEEGRGSKQTEALWRTLYAHGADVVLSGHQHFYERLDPQDQNGDADRKRGIRSFVVGTGGKNIDQADYRDPNSAVYDASTFGELEMTLHPAGYSWRFRPTTAEVFPDRGSARCH